MKLTGKLTKALVPITLAALVGCKSQPPMTEKTYIYQHQPQVPWPGWPLEERGVLREPWPVEKIEVYGEPSPFEKMHATPLYKIGATSITTADIDNDNDNDLIIGLINLGERRDTVKLEIFLNDGKGNYTPK